MKTNNIYCTGETQKRLVEWQKRMQQANAIRDPMLMRCTKRHCLKKMVQLIKLKYGGESEEVAQIIARIDARSQKLNIKAY